MTLSTAIARRFNAAFPAHAVRKAPRSVRAWLPLIEHAAERGRLSPHHLALVKAHEISVAGHAVNAFAELIESRCADRLEALAKAPAANVGEVIEELVRWKTVAQC